MQADQHSKRQYFTQRTALKPLVLAIQLCLASSALYANPPAAVSHSAQHYQIQPTTLRQALSAFALQAGVNIAMNADQLLDAPSAGLSGQYTLEQGFAELLHNTPYRVKASGKGYVLVKKNTDTALPDQQAHNNIVQLQPIELYAQANPYQSPASISYISKQDMNRFGGSSPADLLKGVPGVESSDGNNGGTLEVNIRGLQMHNRVAVSIDGVKQQTFEYHGYAGGQNRTYIDPNLISSIRVQKGYSLNPSSSNANAGEVVAQTLQVEDILLEGKKFGGTIKLGTQNNSIAPHSSNYPTYSSYDQYTYDHYATMPQARKQSQFKGWNGLFALAYSDTQWDLLAAYSQNNRGNYFTGKKGVAKYDYVTEFNGKVLPTNKFIDPGKEQPNTSLEQESILLKSKYKISSEQDIELTYRHQLQKNGQIMGSRYGWDCPSLWGGIDICDKEKAGSRGFIEFPQSESDMHSANLSYRYNPADNPLLNLSSNVWLMRNTVEAYTNFAMSLYVEQNYNRKKEQRNGFNLNNISTWHDVPYLGDVQLELGAAYENAKINASLLPELENSQVDTQSLKNSLINAEWEDISSTANLIIHPLDKLTLQGGFRFNRSQTTDDASDKYENVRENGQVVSKSLGMHQQSYRLFSPVFVADYQFIPSLSAYSRYSIGKRAPSITENTGAEGTNARMTGLKPESTKAFEVGIKGQFNNLLNEHDQLSYKLSYYNNKTRNYINRIYADAEDGSYGNAMLSWFNLDLHQIKGYELQLNYDMDTFYTGLNVHYAKTKICDASMGESDPYLKPSTPCDTDFSYSYYQQQVQPKQMVNLILGTRLLDRKLDAGIRIRWQGKSGNGLSMTANSGQRALFNGAPSLSFVDLYMDYKINQHWTTNLAVDNLTDRYYLNPQSKIWIASPGRTIRASVQYKW
ncbi:TonB-dependent receptor [Acinetobacter larvae]|uniref:Secretin/TonB short N-terminal domain-containing protein n=1 Tax=Acinetobacter larvae TaxID=1789224 RepID=A0A1B2LYF8_9GAMM|nr:TonB-dependent receptor [Acinetobacter larvae]AOA57919.1 hypothetical protein BFG52_05845 [Acinetobacter larvae]